MVRYVRCNLAIQMNEIWHRCSHQKRKAFLTSERIRSKFRLKTKFHCSFTVRKVKPGGQGPQENDPGVLMHWTGGLVEHGGDDSA